MDGVKRDAVKIRLLLRSLARNESTTVANNTLKGGSFSHGPFGRTEDIPLPCCFLFCFDHA